MHRNGPFDAEDLARIGTEAARLAWAAGMTVLRPDGTVVPIPLVAEPELPDRERLSWLADESRAILSGSVKLARLLVSRGDPRDREALLGPFEGLEAEAMARLFDGAPCPAVVSRVDFLPPADGGLPRALELNATIPAMPAYADLAAHSWIRAAARARGLSPRRERDLVAQAGSHMEALRETLVAFYRWRGGTKERPSIAIVARPGDAQIGELRRLEAHFRQMGHAVAVLVPDAADPDAHDLLYRHVWAHRTPPGSPFARALREPARWPLAHPVNGLLEAKALFARLSESAGDPALSDAAGLDAAERAAAARLPWTRLHGESTVERLLADRERHVLKRSWDYGGKSVHLGAETAPADWERVVREAALDRRGGGFVAQERVFAARRPATRITPAGVEPGSLYRDVSTYGGLLPVHPRGSVVRAAASPVVNILGGGGLAPVVPRDVWDGLA
ncbi:MAG TPA: hypothetical protein PLL32_03055 [Anaeromyxobacteraceae bacterium]|nr:hypothetical protein [Anaeromyxobacteraceae bacterium]